MNITAIERKQLIKRTRRKPKEPRNVRTVFGSKAVKANAVGVTYIMAVWNEGSATSRSMADLLGVTTSTSSHMLRSLVDKGYLVGEMISRAGYSEASYTIAEQGA